MHYTPHDALFKAIFRQPEHARPILRAVLPPPLVRHLRFDTLRLVSGSFVDEQLQDRHADLVFTVEVTGAPGLLYILFEHQSTPDPLMPWRLYRYEGDVWNGYLEENAQVTRIPLIIPVVLYHGATPWRAPRSLRDVYDSSPALLADIDGYVPNFSFLLDDLAAQSDAELRERALGPCPTLVLWALKHARHEEDMISALRSVGDLCLAVLGGPAGRQALARVFRYILEVSDMRPETMSEFVKTELGTEAHEAFVTGAELLRREGRKQGRKQGRKEGLCELLTAQLEQRFGPLPEPVRTRLESAEAEQLGRWGRRVLVAPSLAEVFADEP